MSQPPTAFSTDIFSPLKKLKESEIQNPPPHQYHHYNPPTCRHALNQIFLYQCPLGNEEIESFKKNPISHPKKPDPQIETIQRFICIHAASKHWRRPYR